MDERVQRDTSYTGVDNKKGNSQGRYMYTLPYSPVNAVKRILFNAKLERGENALYNFGRHRDQSLVLQFYQISDKLHVL